MYESASRFIDDIKTTPNIAQYDFKNESPVKIENTNPIHRILEYHQNREKISGNNNSNSAFFCNHCPLASDIYKILWGWWQDDSESTPHDVKMLADMWDGLDTATMNVFVSTYNNAKQLYPIKWQASINRDVQEFARLTHTIGNFTLLPHKLNKGDYGSFDQFRGTPNLRLNDVWVESPYFVHDFFDLSLKLIQENVGETIFKKYIDTFFLNDYVDSDYKIIPLFKRHVPILNKRRILHLSIPDMFQPLDLIELDEYLKNINRLIVARGNRIVEELEKR